MPFVVPWEAADRAAAAQEPELYQEHLEFSADYMNRELTLKIKHFENIPGIDFDSTIIIEDKIELNLGIQREVPVAPRFLRNVLPLPGALARLSPRQAAAELANLRISAPRRRELTRRNTALNQLFAARGIIDEVLATSTARGISIRDALSERVWADAPHTVSIHGREYWTQGVVHPELFADRALYRRGLVALRRVNPALRLNGSLERLSQAQCVLDLLARRTP